VIIGIALVFSSFTTPVMSVLFTFFLFAIGRFSSDIRLLAEQVKNPVVGFLTEVIYRLIPNLEKFDVRREAVYGGSVSAELILYTTAYAILYILALLVLSIIIFEKREFK
jgi:chromate transport protein ChrA